MCMLGYSRTCLKRFENNKVLNSLLICKELATKLDLFFLSSFCRKIQTKTATICSNPLSRNSATLFWELILAVKLAAKTAVIEYSCEYEKALSEVTTATRELFLSNSNLGLSNCARVIAGSSFVMLKDLRRDSCADGMS